jgi:hypothetical protein
MRLKRIAFTTLIILLVAASTPWLHQALSFSKTHLLALASDARSSETDSPNVANADAPNVANANASTQELGSVAEQSRTCSV